MHKRTWLRQPVWFRIDLRRLILSLAMFSALVMLANGFFATYQVQRELLIQGTLDANGAYAAKVAAATDNYLRQAQRQLAYGAAALASASASGDRDTQRISTEVERLREQADIFNTVVYVGATGKVLETSPSGLRLRGKILDTRGSREALSLRTPLISNPYTSTLGNLVIVMSHPVESQDGHYLGYIAGTIYLRQENVLYQLLKDHFYRDGSYVYVVDRARHLLYHPDAERIGTKVTDNVVVDAVLAGQSGQQRVINSRGIDMLAGYAYMPTMGWGVVAQRPANLILDQLDGLMLDAIGRSIWPGLLVLVLVWLAARLISEPLGGLSRVARDMDAPDAFGRIERVHSWYFESAQLKRAMLAGISLLQLRIGRLRQDAQSDPMTGLQNRRGLEFTVETWQAMRRPFSVAIIDIDHFKAVNDEFGHDVGDRVIKRVAEIMREHSREGDVLCRAGGEEFLMLWPELLPLEARSSAERLRLAIAAADMGLGRAVSVSIGIAAWPRGEQDFSQVLKAADQALYQAKNMGRNCTVVDPGTDPAD